MKSGPVDGHAGCVLTAKLTILGSGAEGVLELVFGAVVVTTGGGGALLLLEEDWLELAGLEGELLEAESGVEAGADALSVAELLAAAGVLSTAEPVPADVLEHPADTSRADAASAATSQRPPSNLSIVVMVQILRDAGRGCHLLPLRL